jgi:uncharacterized protein
MIYTLRAVDPPRDIAANVRVASNFWARFRGLMLVARLEPGEALAFRPGGTIHMMFMRFAIDAVFCGGDGRVLKVGRNVRPWIGVSRAPRGTKLLIEMAAGAADSIHPGDVLMLVAVTESP